MVNDTPIFIIGNPRSGTSLLRLMLHSHPLISIPPGITFFFGLKKNTLIGIYLIYQTFN
ncbi:MAG: sulfotransferase [Bacteroidetes bacterium]|nr:sulfotransferase [Bacteroidota bacterium]